MISLPSFISLNILNISERLFKVLILLFIEVLLCLDGLFPCVFSLYVVSNCKVIFKGTCFQWASMSSGWSSSPCGAVLCWPQAEDHGLASCREVFRWTALDRVFASCQDSLNLTKTPAEDLWVPGMLCFFFAFLRPSGPLGSRPVVIVWEW